jgi:hypothetical protein
MSTAAIIVIAALAVAQHPAMPAGMTHEEHLAQKEADLKARGAAAMGFDQDAAAHRFLITEQGGAIEVVAKNASDAVTREAIRTHLKTIAREFADGVFSKPVATHGETPDGVADMRRLNGSIRYRYSDRPGGGRVDVIASRTEAIAAVHAFLRYQIREHGTGDPR